MQDEPKGLLAEPQAYFEENTPVLLDNAVPAELVQKVKHAFEKYNTTEPFLSGAGSPTFVLQDTIDRINDKSFNQAQRDSCGPASVMQVVVQYEPEQLAEIIAEVYYTGKIKSMGYVMSKYLKNLDFASEVNGGLNNMKLGSLLVFATALRDKRNQYLASIDQATVPGDGFDEIRAKKDVGLVGSSFFSTVYDVSFFYEMLGYTTKTYIGRTETCPACIGTVDSFFPSDLAAAEGIFKEYSTTGTIDYSMFPWSKRVINVLKTGGLQVFHSVVSQYMTGMGMNGLKFACEYAGSVSLEINDEVLYGYTHSTCNGAVDNYVCLPDHWVQLTSCDFKNDVCEFVSQGGVESYPCTSLANVAVAAVAAEKDNIGSIRGQSKNKKLSSQ